MHKKLNLNTSVTLLSRKLFCHQFLCNLPWQDFFFFISALISLSSKKWGKDIINVALWRTMVCKRTSLAFPFCLKSMLLARSQHCALICLFVYSLSICLIFISTWETDMQIPPAQCSSPWQLVHSQLVMTGRKTCSLSPLAHCRLRKRTGSTRSSL